jgi:hypothetical protein
MNGYNTPPEYLDFVHPHWLRYEAPNPFLHHLLGVLYIFLMIGSLCGNRIFFCIKISKVYSVQIKGILYFRKRGCSLDFPNVST